MLCGYDVYCLYHKFKLHFNSEKYNLLAYNNIPKSLQAKYNNDSGRIFFERLGVKYSNKKQLSQLFLANFLNDQKFYIRNAFSNECYMTYRLWKARILSIENNFKEDIQHIKLLDIPFKSVLQYKDSNHPILFKLLLQDMITLETFLILDQLFGLINKYNDMDNDPVWLHWKLKLKKYQLLLPHYDRQKYGNILKQNL